jgi:hypothetical protein
MLTIDKRSRRPWRWFDYDSTDAGLRDHDRGRELPMSEVAYVSEVRIEREGGPNRRGYLPGESDPVLYGMHGAVAEHYGYEAGEFRPRATTLDHVVGAAAG